jgi:hypothetical protein
MYSPVELSVPALKELPVGPESDQVTPVLKLPVPATEAANCTCVPMVAEPGVTVIDVMAGPAGVGVGLGVPELPPTPQPVKSRPILPQIDTLQYQPNLLMGL